MTTSHGNTLTSPIDQALEMLRGFTVVDLSHTLEEGIPAHAEHSRFYRMLWESYYHGDTAVAYQLILNEHTGTHVDAPAHFMREGHPQHVWINEVDPTRIVARAAVVDVRDKVVDGEFGIEVLTAFEVANGPINAGDIVLFDTGWADKWAVRPDNKAYTKGFPGPSEALVGWLKDKNLHAVGADTLAFDREGSNYPSHWQLLAEGVLIIENLCNLHDLPPYVLFMALPLKIEGGSASPIRAVAYVPRS